MGRVYKEIEPALADFIRAQRVFFVASAPLAGGHVNLSPKGLDTLRILSPHRVAYLDLTGSGAETAAHLRENGRLTMMFMAFEGAPKILRLHGVGSLVELSSAAYAALAPHFPPLPGARAIITLDVTRVSDSCGFGVPRYAFQGERETLTALAEKRGARGLRDYREQKNAHSIDGLPALSEFEERR